MINFFTKLLNRNKPSSAEIILEDLLNKGVLQVDITSNHLMRIYSSLKKSRNSPKFSSINEILPNDCEEGLNSLHHIWGVIVETRKHPSLEYVVTNFMKNTQAPIQIFHGKNNLAFIMSTTISKLVRSGDVYLTKLDIDELDASEYNALLLSKSFWLNILGRKKILIFQTDAISCSQSSYTINDFTSYDYIGSSWRRNRLQGLIIDGGNGGLSLRDWKKTYDCLSRFLPKYWPSGEDGYFAFHIELIGGKVGKFNECAKFSTQNNFLFNSWGAHKISRLNSKDQDNFITYCPEAEFILKNIKK